MPKELIEKAKQLLADAEDAVKGIEERVDATQLGVAVHRLGLFVEHIGQVKADEPERQAREDADDAAETENTDSGEKDLESLTRDELNAHAESVGVEAPHKLPNKGAVIEAIGNAGGAGDTDSGEPQE